MIHAEENNTCICMTKLRRLEKLILDRQSLAVSEKLMTSDSASQETTG